MQERPDLAWAPFTQDAEVLANAACKKMEHIVANGSVHTALQATSKDLHSNLRANLLIYASSENWVLAFFCVSDFAYISGNSEVSFPVSRVGWGSEEDLVCSSGSESRESGSGHDSRRRMVLPRPPGGNPRPRRAKPARTPPTSSPSEPYSQLSLDIPGKQGTMTIFRRSSF